VKADEAAPASRLASRGRVLERVRVLVQEHAGLRRLAHDAQVREAQTRTELGLALYEAVGGVASREAQLRDQALAAWRRLARRRSVRRHNRLSRRLDQWLVRLGAFGQALVIARSGVWRGTGRPLHDLRHMAAYARRGPNPAIAPLAPFSQAAYLDLYPDVARGRMSPLAHYLAAGAAEGRTPSPAFDAAGFAARHAQPLAASGVSPLEHYVRVVAATGEPPHPLFDVGHYLAQGVDLAPDDDPLSHYLREGAARGLSPGPLFDPAWYAAQVPDIGGEPPLVHYLRRGWREGLSPHPLVDVRWYLETYPDVADAGVEPLGHFLETAEREMRAPGPWFDTAAYVAARGADRPAGLNPLIDYLQGGAWAAREFGAGPAASVFVSREPALARQGVTPLEFWARQGGPPAPAAT
jgi:hypothetical protein